MNDRMLNKEVKPSFEEMSSYCGIMEKLFLDLNNFIKERFMANSEIKFPYGNNYGWCISHHKKTKLICNLFPEKDSFCVMIRKTNKEFLDVYNTVSDYAKEIIDNRYPCNNGGWIHFRVRNEKDYSDIVQILSF